MNSKLNLLIRLYKNLNKKRRLQLLLLLFMMLIATFAELLSLGSVIPFITVLVQPDKLYVQPYVQPLVEFMNIKNSSELTLPLTIIFCFCALITGAVRIFLLWMSTWISFRIGADISNAIYSKTLYQPYQVHCERNSSEIINGIVNKSNAVIYNVIVPVLTIISSTFLLSIISIVLLLWQPKIFITIFLSFGVLYFILITITRNQLLKDGVRISRESTNQIRSLQEGLGGIRDVLLDNSQKTFISIYEKADLAMRRSQGNAFFISQFPRYGMESLGLILIAIFSLILIKRNENFTDIIPIVGALVLSAQRLLPLMQQTYAAWASIRSGESSLIDTLALLEQKMPSYLKIENKNFLEYNKVIELKNIYFKYNSSGDYSIKNINLLIKKGSRIGFIGSTGSGKSTLLDIIMGLLQPTGGVIEVDGRLINDDNRYLWQALIAHVPQTIYLADSSVEENIAFGVPHSLIDKAKVYESAKKAKIAEIIDSWPLKYNTVVGERGVRLSGGQRQRIGIARALYKNAKVIVFDEATSSLDSDTEEAVMEAIEGLNQDLTLLIIAHRITTLKKCDVIYEINKGQITRELQYSELVS
jgi:ABC-type multidrug transport system fused ATPase/permease subunit